MKSKNLPATQADDRETLMDLVCQARNEMPDVPPETWDRFLAVARERFGTCRLYVHAPRRRYFEAVSAALSTPTAQLAKQLGLSERHVRRLKRNARAAS